MTNVWEPLKELIKSHSPLTTIDGKIYKKILLHFQKTRNPLEISKLTESMKEKHLIPSEKTLTIIQKMADTENGQRPIISITRNNEIVPEDGFYQDRQ